MSDLHADKAVQQMRSVVGIVGLAWLCAVVPLLIGVASVGGAAWGEPPVLLTFVGGIAAIAGAAGTWLLRPWGPIVHVSGALLMIVKSFVFASVAAPFHMPWGFLAVLAIFVVVVVSNRQVFRGRHA